MDRGRKTGLRWLLVVAVLVLACVIALWPRGGDQGGSDRAAPAPVRTSAAQPPVRVNLPGCPGGSGGQVAQLRGVHTNCLADGSDVDLGAALAGRTTLVNVWASWCAPCREELPRLAEYANRKGAANVLLVQVQSDPEQGRAMLGELGVRLPAVHDSGAARAALAVPPALPASYVVTADGAVHFVTEPRVFTETDSIAAAVDRYKER
ncbi:TlpA family protein disulfide reductase [Sciscionella sediminilitoris]|uniref:TlpA family protein disulfide reductase n=1 Tax=Sciscionella sediminilitoris TaxID=1445613 RepID=UPI0004DED5AB|nr:TlpA disulfide reductase family protein [Sciscionella sp. SE31]